MEQKTVFFLRENVQNYFSVGFLVEFILCYTRKLTFEEGLVCSNMASRKRFGKFKIIGEVR